MKKEINDLLGRRYAVYRLNAISQLRRLRLDVRGKECDELSIDFFAINGDARTFQNSYRIKSRDFNGIIAECVEHTRAHFSFCFDRIENSLVHGYNPDGVVKDLPHVLD